MESASRRHPPFDRTLNRQNIDQNIEGHIRSIQGLGDTILGRRGLDLLKRLKRDPLPDGPYPGVTLFEAANRVMSDLVILYGIKWLLHEQVFPFDCYRVQYGTESESDFDIEASQAGMMLIGEAFNVAPSFFSSKKTTTLSKLRSRHVAANFKVLMFNDDAVPTGYIPKRRDGEFYIAVDIYAGTARQQLAQVRSSL